MFSTEIFSPSSVHSATRSALPFLRRSCLASPLSAFPAQRLWLGRRNFATVSGNGAGGVRRAWRRWPYGRRSRLLSTLILFGSIVRVWGFDHSLTLDHYGRDFAISFSDGIAWNRFWTGIEIAAPLTAAVGMLTAWLIVRKRFPGRDILEFVRMLSFALPGMVIGISCIIAVNLPPIQMTDTATILVFCFIFSNTPVGVRGGVGATSQLDGSLDEASLSLGASSWRALRRMILPLLRPAVLATLI